MAVSRFKTSTSLARSKNWIMSGRKFIPSDDPNISFVGQYTYHYFGITSQGSGYNDTDKFIFETEPGTVIDYLIVGGGGSGGKYGNPSDTRGGEGGEVKTGTYTAEKHTYEIVVGGGGTGWTSIGPGKDSSAFGITAKGGRENIMTGSGADGTYVPLFSQFGVDIYHDVTGFFGGDGGQGKTGGAVGYPGGKGGGGQGAEKENGNPNPYFGLNGMGGGGGGANGGNFANAAGHGGSGVVILRYLTKLNFIYE